MLRQPMNSRYHKQELFGPIGTQGQARIAAARVLVCGCGALGSVVAEQLVRAGTGLVRIVDRDFVDLSNLQRQMLFDEEDVAQQMPKAIAAEKKLRRINSEIEIEGVVADVSPTTIGELADGVDVIVDGTDNFETRFLLNDYALEHGLPWVHGGCIASYGQVMAIVPGKTPCYRCVVSEPPEAGMGLTCDTAGVIGPAVNVIASLEVSLALQIITGELVTSPASLWHIDVWRGEFRKLDLSALVEEGCPACRDGRRDWLRGTRGASSAVMCGRNSVQITPGGVVKVSLEELKQQWAGMGEVTGNAFLVRLQPKDVEGVSLTVFRDGRGVVQGTEDVGVAKSVYGRFVGG